MNKKLLLFIALYFSANVLVWGQVPLSFKNRYTAKTFERYENVYRDSIKRFVSYEQRLYRNPLMGALELRAILRDSSASYIPLFQGVPMAAYKIGKDGIEVRELSAFSRENIPFSSRKYKFDFWIQPQFIANFGNYNQPVQSKTNILLNTQIYLSRGLVLNGGVTFPIVNDLDGQQLNIRPAPIYLNQFLALGKSNFMSISCGLFYNDQYGINVQYRKNDFNSNWSYGLEGSLTGFYFFPANGIYYEKLDQFMMLGDVTYRLDRANFLVKLSGGQFMYQDRGARIDLIRQFSTVDIGFFVMKTGNGATLGFNLAVPLFANPILQGKSARLRMVDEFRWEYNYTRGYNIGERYRLGYQLDEKLRQYNRGYWQSMFERWK
ncbi:Exopolysaccharide biosynthesis protein YbjH [Pseudarcicella hirudinis]|uniref:Exopolysaccharide biosynthesis protein YbjH n=1 Tax=Pseudarcicella hirudinis TaxID=1079859 RepID=A0A1I5YQJ6_9BACT|nr:YjbH domain-containing protein [Pseudarcicella hirudinis]SFQ46157.1 Exopolysaccharide biosynthesis protein YbjH [Pseudarcicella hirudinis]